MESYVEFNGEKVKGWRKVLAVAASIAIVAFFLALLAYVFLAPFILATMLAS